MTQPDYERGRDDPDRSPGWLTRLFEEKLANGGAPDNEAALAALKRFDAAIMREGPVGFQSDQEIEDFIDAYGPVWHIDTWPLVPWSYWEARGAGPYRR